MFHELAHQVAYAKNDSAFNESFAVVVEREGVRRWLGATKRTVALNAFFAARERRQKFAAEIEQARARLKLLYRQPIAPEAMREAKRVELDSLKARLAGDARFKDRDPNNAFLASFSTYTELVPTFEHLLQEDGGDLERFYARVKKYAASPPAERGALSAPGR